MKPTLSRTGRQPRMLALGSMGGFLGMKEVEIDWADRSLRLFDDFTSGEGGSREESGSMKEIVGDIGWTGLSIKV